MTAPATVGINMPSRYQIARNGASISGQCSAYISAPTDPANKPAAAPASASRVGAEIDVELLPHSSALTTVFDTQALQGFQLSGGDDYELCFTATKHDAVALLGDLARSGCAATRIGRIVAEPGVRAYDRSGNRVTMPRPGWEHFA